MELQQLLDLGFEYFSYNAKSPILFNSGLFFVLFLCFYSIYFAFEKNIQFRIGYVLLFSLFFYYKSSGEHFILLIASTLWDFWLAKAMYRCKSDEKPKRTFFLILSMMGNLGMLAYYKYTNFIIQAINDCSGTTTLSPIDLVLPVGISFFTFQTMSYSIDVYRGELKPCKNLFEFGFFVSFFPQLVAGPIVRAKDFIPQIREKLELSRQDMGFAFWLIMGGLFKKAVISDYISVNFVDRIFENPGLYSGTENLLAVYGYSIQIYCDFSGYSDMAIGLALLMGFKLPPNFMAPYQSLSVTEFWRRWHISLSTWLRDYLYISLGGNRGGSFGSIFFLLFFMGISLILTPHLWLAITYGVAILLVGIYMLSGIEAQKKAFNYMNLGVTMLLGGLWHGPSWRFVVWGALHGGALALEKMFQPVTKMWKGKWWAQLLGGLLTFHFVAYCWIYFRAPSFELANLVIDQIRFQFSWELIPVVIHGYSEVFALILLGFIVHLIPIRFDEKLQKLFSRLPWALQAFFIAAVILLVIQVASSEVRAFIYFQF